MSFHVVQRTRTTAKSVRARRANYCFLLLSMQICDVIVAVAIEIG